MDFKLKQHSQQSWLDAVLGDFDQFLVDHASCEKKASGMAISMISHYPDKPILVKAMLDLAIEELAHFRDVMALLVERGLQSGSDQKDPYVNQLHKAMDQGAEAYLLDRLLIASIVEARGAERFGMIAKALPDGRLKTFYQSITESENQHYKLFLSLAEQYCETNLILPRLQQLLEIEADIIQQLPDRPALH